MTYARWARRGRRGPTSSTASGWCGSRGPTRWCRRWPFHCDLGVEHIRVDPPTARPCGLVDFDWASVGDPALDFVGLLTALGPDAAHRLIGAYGDGVSWQRLLFYWWLTPCYELVYAGDHLDEAAARRLIEAVRSRLAALTPLRDRGR